MKYLFQFALILFPLINNTLYAADEIAKQMEERKQLSQPLWVAVRDRDYAKAEELIRRQADLSFIKLHTFASVPWKKTSYMRVNAFGFAILREDGKLIKMFLDGGYRTPYANTTALQYATRQGKNDAVKYLLEMGEHTVLGRIYPSGHLEPMTPICIALTNKDHVTLRVLLSNKRERESQFVLCRPFGNDSLERINPFDWAEEIAKENINFREIVTLWQNLRRQDSDEEIARENINFRKHLTLLQNSRRQDSKMDLDSDASSTNASSSSRPRRSTLPDFPQPPSTPIEHASLSTVEIDRDSSTTVASSSTYSSPSSPNWTIPPAHDSESSSTPREYLSPPKTDVQPYKSYTVAPRYLGQNAIPQSSSSSEVANASAYEPSFWLKRISEHQGLDQIGQQCFDIADDKHNFSVSYCTSKFCSQQELMDELKNHRITFVYPGRGVEGFAPLENGDTGRVIYVITSDQQKDFAVNPYSDFLVIKHLQPFNQDSLGTLTARRLASLYLSHYTGINDFVMLDDNIESFKSTNQEITDWQSLYHFIRTGADNTLKIISIPNHNPRFAQESLTTQSENPDRDIKRDIKTRVGSKFFFVRAQDIFVNELQQIENIKRLLPRDPAIWGEDLWMNLYVSLLGFKVGTADRSLIEMQRARKANRGICQRVVRRAQAWYDQKHLAEDPDLITRKVYAIITKIVERSEASYGRNLKCFREKELSQFQKRPTSSSSSSGQLHFLSAASVNRVKRKRDDGDEKKPAQSRHAAASSSSTIRYLSAPVLVGKLDRLLSSHDFNLLRPHQIEALKAARENFSQGKNVGYFKMITRSGKTRIFSTLALLAKADDANVAIIAPSQIIKDQIYDELLNLNQLLPESMRAKEHLLIKISSADIKQQDFRLHGSKGYIAVFCLESFKRMLEAEDENIETFSSFFVDELHRLNHDTLSHIKNYVDATNALFLGFSSTPTKGKKKHFLNEIFFEYSFAQGRKDKLISEIDYIQLDLGILFEDPWRFLNETNARDGQKLIDKQGIIKVASIKDAKELEDRLCAHEELKDGVRALYTSDNAEDERRIIAEFSKPRGASQLRILIVVKKASEGFTAPVDYLISMKKKLGKTSLRQFLGRGMQHEILADGNEKVLQFFYDPNSVDDKWLYRDEPVAMLLDSPRPKSHWEPKRIKSKKTDYPGLVADKKVEAVIKLAAYFQNFFAIVREGEQFLTFDEVCAVASEHTHFIENVEGVLKEGGWKTLDDWKLSHRSPRAYLPSEQRLFELLR